MNYQKDLSFNMKKFLKDAYAFYTYMQSTINDNDLRVKFSLLLASVYNVKLMDKTPFLLEDCVEIFKNLNISDPNIINNYPFDAKSLDSLFASYIQKYSKNIYDQSKIANQDLRIEYILYNLMQEKEIDDLLKKILPNNNYHIIKMKLIDSFTNLKEEKIDYKSFAKTLNAPMQELVFLSLAYYQQLENQTNYWTDKDEIALFLGGINFVSVISKEEKSKIHKYFGIGSSISSVPYDYIQRKIGCLKEVLNYINENAENNYSAEFLNTNGIYVALYYLLERPFNSLHDYLKEIFDNDFIYQFTNRIRQYLATNNKSEEKKLKIYEEKRNQAGDVKDNRTVGKTLKQYGIFLKDYDYPVPPAIGREKELRNLKIALLKSKSIILLGEAGVGKTALVKGLAYDLKNGQVPDLLKNIEIVKIDLQGLIAGTKYRGDFEERVKNLVDDLKKWPNIVAYIEELHTVYGLGDSDGSFDLMNMLKPYLADSQIKIIGDTTIQEYDKFIAKDAAFSRRFIVETITEPNLESLKQIALWKIKEFKFKYLIDFKFNMQIQNIIIESLLELTSTKNQSYYSTRKNPDILIDTIENIFAIAAYHNHKLVTFDDLFLGMNLTTDVNEASKNRIIYELKEALNIKKQEENSRVLKFPSKYALKK